jgi:hypothetical protein
MHFSTSQLDQLIPLLFLFFLFENLDIPDYIFLVVCFALRRQFLFIEGQDQRKYQVYSGAKNFSFHQLYRAIQLLLQYHTRFKNIFLQLLKRLFLGPPLALPFINI